jgi:hypothetical protein
MISSSTFTRATKSRKSNSPITSENGRSYYSIPSTSPPFAPRNWRRRPRVTMQFRKGGAEILAVSMNTAFVRKAWHDNSPSIAKIACLLVANPTTELYRHFRTHMEDLRLPVRGTFIIDPNGVLKARAFTTKISAESNNRIGFGRQDWDEFETA